MGSDLLNWRRLLHDYCLPSLVRSNSSLKFADEIAVVIIRVKVESGLASGDCPELANQMLLEIDRPNRGERNLFVRFVDAKQSCPLDQYSALGQGHDRSMGRSCLHLIFAKILVAFKDDLTEIRERSQNCMRFPRI